MTRMLCLALLLVSLGVAHAGDYVGESTTTPGKFTRYLDSRDPTQAIPQTDEVLHAVSEANTPSQRAINLGQPYATPPVPPSVPVKYRQVVGGLVFEMSAADKQQVDAALAAQAAVQQQYQQELATNEGCKENFLARISEALATRKANKLTALQAAQDAFQAEIDAMPPPNLTVAIDMFTKANVRMHEAVRVDIQDEYQLFENVARCLLAARKARG